MQPTTPTDFTALNDDVVTPNESRYAHDSKLYVEFFRKPCLHPGKSQEAGRAVYEERDFVRIHVPGDKTSVCVEPMHEMNLQRFADRYAKWKAGQAEAVVGTPLSALPGMTPAKVEEYKFFKVVTVEQLAAANDNLGGKFMGFQQDKQRAKAFLEVAAGNAPIERMNHELAQRDAEIDTLKQQMQALMSKLGGTKRSKAEVAEATE